MEILTEKENVYIIIKILAQFIAILSVVLFGYISYRKIKRYRSLNNAEPN